MSKDILIWARIDASYQEKNIKNILKKGSKLGFTYYKFILGEMNVGSEPLSIDAATQSVLAGDPDGGLHCLTIQIQDTYATLHFLNNEILSVMLSGLSHLWSKTFVDGSEDIDVARYAKMLLDLVSDFKILEMHIEKD